MVLHWGGLRIITSNICSCSVNNRVQETLFAFKFFSTWLINRVYGSIITFEIDAVARIAKVFKEMNFACFLIYSLFQQNFHTRSALLLIFKVLL